ncbi:MAG TPA: HAD family phosphatase [Gemmatimonadaceae bacterium]|jgi:putative hydrolase of the HAD superfamily
MNVVFDLGGVVVAWNPNEIITNAVADPAIRPAAMRHIMKHPDWLELDRGTMEIEDAITRAVERSGLDEALVRGVVESVPAALVANDETVALMRRVKAAGNALYVLSNMPTGSMEYLEQRYDFWDLFDGAVISSRVHYCKPEREIYEHLLRTYTLVPGETVFIDDVAANVEGARAVGIHAIQFTSVAQTEEELCRLGCL